MQWWRPASKISSELFSDFATRLCSLIRCHASFLLFLLELYSKVTPGCFSNLKRSFRTQAWKVHATKTPQVLKINKHNHQTSHRFSMFRLHGFMGFMHQTSKTRCAWVGNSGAPQMGWWKVGGMVEKYSLFLDVKMLNDPSQNVYQMEIDPTKRCNDISSNDFNAMRRK